MRDEQLHAIVYRGAKHIWESKCTKHLRNSTRTRHTIARPLWNLRCQKNAQHGGEKHISKSECQKPILRPLLKMEMSKKCTPMWREGHIQVKIQNVKHTTCSDHFWAQGIVHLVKSEHNVKAFQQFQSQPPLQLQHYTGLNETTYTKATTTTTAAHRHTTSRSCG